MKVPLKIISFMDNLLFKILKIIHIIFTKEVILKELNMEDSY
jgi:hypothetical protein